ncbi:hypothetical protein K461DRAFT_7805 [Myriangium duriaei CBS 260.36]|uniref:C2H2-type domain-containing protein n=1 Tax=Myriangium duriaei CBS 260.36 TaxID=1168546 RepID=A0A9P4JA91_9PEZI|nr:hypothetical protein K461DRAFT_7805 [Myriangium duriaei CBS 260.36]
MDPVTDTAASSDDSSHTEQNIAGVKRKRRDTNVTIDTAADGNGSDKDDKERHQCPHCDRSFGRVEHMKRHAASHSNERPFRCATCDKGFHRLDTMQRHELIHRDHAENAKPKGARACTECALAKVRCPGGMPCTRCEAKGGKCRYPDVRNRTGDPSSPSESTIDPLPRQGSYDAVQPLARSQSITGVSYSPAVWPDGPTSPQQWLPPSATVEMAVPRPEFQDRPAAARHLSFSSNGARPTGLASLNGSDPYSNLRQAGFVTAAPDAVSLSGSTTRNWLETLLAPQAIDVRDASTPDNNSSHKTSSISETYLDGDGARLPKIGIRRRYNFRPSLSVPAPGPAVSLLTSTPSYNFPPHFCQPDLEMAPSERRLLGESTYADIRRNFEQTCGPQSSYSPCFESPDYPSWDQMHMFIQIYLDEFQPLVPMLHQPTLNLHSSHWLLSLALASMGCHFADMPEAEYCALALNEHLRRAVGDLEISENSIDPVLLAQVKLLNCIGMIYCGDERMENFGWRQHADVVRFCRTHWVNEDSVQLPTDAHLYSEVEVEWRHWRDIEARRRTGYGIWLLDCMWAYGYLERNLLSLEDAKVPVPCQEVLWEAESALQWQHVKSYSVPMPSLNSATHSVYIEKRVESTMGEFSRILLIHALYSASWSIQTHLSNPMSHWTPRATKLDLNTLPSFREPIFLPSEPSYFRWRNATCDCLDILHWRANSVTGASSGVEHPTLLHLHLARIILLTPFREICNLAFGLSGMTMNVTTHPQSSPAELAANRALVRRWAEQDQPKARLAMYHAGVLFWHIRLYSAKGAYEPTAVLLAALALWAFGTFAPKHPMSAAPASSPLAQLAPGITPDGDDDASAFPTSINIDRPADDEIVQMYIRQGDRMQALIVGVGDIRSPMGPQRVLLEGAKLVSSLANWGSSRRVMSVLVTLARVVRESGVG